MPLSLVNRALCDFTGLDQLGFIFGKDRVCFIIKDAHLLGLLDLIHARLIRKNIEQAESERDREQYDMQRPATAPVDLVFL